MNILQDNDNDKESTGFSSTITNLPLIQTKNKQLNNNMYKQINK